MISLATITEAAQKSGWILYIMSVLLLIALAVMIERFWALSRMLTQCNAWVREIKGHSRVDAARLRARVDAAPQAPAAQVVAVALEHDLDDTLEHFGARLEEAVMDQAPRVDRGLWVLDTIVTLAPLLGLLGTIVGMFNTFQALSGPSTATQQVTGGVGEALLATACGLFIAVLGLVAFNALQQRVRLVMHQLDRIKLMLSNRMYPHYRGDAPQRAPVAPITAGSIHPKVLQQKLA